MTTALYRRYRPDTFQDVIGQEHVTAPLMAALRADKVTHAYLFSGPRGCGKTTSARILARCLNCEKFPTDTPCGQCPSCQDLATGGPGSLDVVEIDAASHNGVDDARDLRERASFAPARDRFKIFILDEAHMVTPQGFNALLKLVEEPPAHVKFIFATTEPEKVIGTIRSRTHHYPFRLVPPDVLEGYLAHLCQAEGVEVGPGVFPLVTRAGGGSVRDTLSVMDQLIGGAIDGEVDYQRAVALLGYTDTTMLDQCIDAIAAADGAGVFRVVDRVVTSGHDPRRFVEDLLQRLRDLLVIALAGTEAGPALGSLPQDELGRMEVQSRTIGAAGLSRAADMTAQALSQMVGATSPRLQLELLMARLLVPSQRPAGAAGAAPVAAPATQAPTAAPTGGGAVATGGVPVGGAPAGGAPRSASEAPAGRGGRARAAEIARRAGAQGVEAAAPGTGDQGAPQDAAVLAGDENEHVSVDWDAPAPVGDGSAPADTAATASPAASRPPTTRSAGTVPPAQGSARAEAGSGASPSEGSAADAEMIRTRWEEVLDAAKRSRRATWALVGPNSQPGSIHGGVFQVLFTGRGLVGAFENGGHGPILAAAIHQALGLELEVHAVLAGGDGDGPGGGGPAGGGSGPRGGGPGNAARAVSASSGRGAPASRGRGRSSDAGASGQRGVPAWDEAPAWDSPQDAGTGTPSATTSSATRPNEDASDAAAPGEAADADDHQTGTTSPGSAPGARGSARSAPAVDDDGWGEAAVPGGGRITEEAAPLSQPTVDAPTAVRGNRLGGGAASPSQRRADAAPATTSHPANESAAARPSEADAAADGGDGDDESMTPAEEAAAGARASEEDPEAQQTEDPALAAAHAAAQRSDEQDEETDEDDDIADLAGDGSRPDASDPGSGEPDIGPSDDRPSQPGHAGSGPLDLERAGSGPSDPGSADPGSSAGAALGSSSAQPSADNASSGRVPPEDDAGRDPDEPRLATVHRLRALPEIPGGASSSGTPTGGAGTESADEPSDDPSRGTTSAAPGSVGEPSGRPAPGGPVGGSSAGRPDRRGLAPVSWDGPASETSSPAPWDAGPQTFSDGIPLPDEPGDPDGPEDGWSPPGQSGRRVSAAMAAARAAARGDAPAAGRGPGGAVWGRPGPGSDDDAVSEDDEDAEEAGVVGLEVVKRLLGATVLEDITINHEGS